MNELKLAGRFQQRVGELIEQHVCKIFNLKFNTNQRKNGYYDAYNKKKVYEIKSSNLHNSRATIFLNNHKKLYNANGQYIMILYECDDQDKELRVISDIQILKIVTISAKKLDDTILKYGIHFNRKQKTKTKEYIRISFKHVIKCSEKH